ncbi:MAG: DUF1501 domain-containing protein, partial [Planctomycetia bacterium]|nr:DUF1501 domain-containing protein [Planctomycetia bacterium]
MESRWQLPEPLLADMLGRLSTSLAAGIDVRRAWEGEARRVPARWRHAMQAVAASLASGSGLGEALSAAGRAFPPFVQGMASVGDQTGHEPETLRDVAETLRAGIRARRALRQSLAQPAFQLAVAAVVVGVLILIAGLLRDLKDRGLLADTLVAFVTEFGRMPTFQKGASGRDHNPSGFTVWLAGAGVKRAFSHGATDEFGYKAAENVATIYDLHATILHLLGLDHTRLSFYNNGIERRLTDVHG